MLNFKIVTPEGIIYEDKVENTEEDQEKTKETQIRAMRRIIVKLQSGTKLRNT